jgi:hypothetical protein
MGTTFIEKSGECSMVFLSRDLGMGENEFSVCWEVVAGKMWPALLPSHSQGRHPSPKGLEPSNGLTHF